MIEVRAIVKGDYGWLRTNRERLFNGEIMVSRGVVHRVLEKPGFIALKQGEPVGVAVYDIVGSNCELVSIEALVRWQGIGSMLIAQVEARAKELEATNLWLITTNDNLDAMRFYQKRGFRLRAVHSGALESSRALKPAIPLIGNYGIAMTDEVELDKVL